MSSKNAAILGTIEQPDKFVEKTLKIFSRDKHPSRLWLQSCLLSDDFRDDHEAFEKLEGLFKQIIKNQLDTLRQAIGFLQTHEVEHNYYGYQDRYSSQDAFNHVLQIEIGGIGELDHYPIKLWSTLYHKYFVLHHLNDEQFARITTLSSRQIRNYKKEGIELLTSHLIELEKDIQTKAQQQYNFKPQTFIEHEAEHLIGLARSARSIHGEHIALQKCDVAIDYAHTNKLARYLVEAVSLKVFTLLQGRVSNVQLAANDLERLQRSEIIQTLEDSPLQKWAMAKITAIWAHIWRRRGNLEQANSCATRSVQWVDELQGLDPDIEKDVYTISGVMYWASGKYDKAEHQLLHILNGNHKYRYDVHGMLGLVNWSRCRYTDAESHFKAAIEQADARQDLWHLACEQGNLGLVYLSRCQLDASETYVKLHRDNAYKLQSWKEHSRATANLGIINLHRGRFDVAIALLEAAKELYDKMSAIESQVVIYSNLSQAHTLIGEHEQALEYAKYNHKLASTIVGSYPPRIVALRCLAECELLDVDVRIQHLRDALAMTAPFRHYDRAACLMALSALVDVPHESLYMQKTGSTLLKEIGADNWLEKSKQKYPHMLLVT